jgi:hypothetical protein
MEQRSILAISLPGKRRYPFILLLLLIWASPVWAQRAPAWQNPIKNLLEKQAHRSSEQSNMAAIAAESLNYLRLLKTIPWPNVSYEIRYAGGGTWHNLSEDDRRETIWDNSLSLGVGSGLPLLPNRYGRVDFMGRLSVSRYTGGGNGWALTPIADLSYTTPRILRTFALYGGFGIGLGKDTMNLPGYTNTYKWTIDFFAGVDYHMAADTHLRFGPMLRHKSHSFVGPWQGQGQNIGYNGLMVEAAMRVVN